MIIRIEIGDTRYYSTISEASGSVAMLRSCMGMTRAAVKAGINYAIEKGCEFPNKSGITWDET